MAETTTAVNACDVRIYVDNDAGTPVDVSGSSNAVTMTVNVETGQYRVFSNRWKKSLECGKDLSLTINAVYTTADSEAKDILADWAMATTSGARTITIYVPDKNVGSDKWSGEWRIQTFEFGADVSEPGAIPITATFISDGTISRVTNAT